MGDYKRIYRNYTILDYHTLKDDLENMANKGYILDSCKINSIYVFRKTGDKNIKYNVCIKKIESAFGRVYKSENQDMKQSCIDTGWNFLCSNHFFHIFYTEENAELLPIYTSEVEEYEFTKPFVQRQMIGYGLNVLVWFGFFIYFILNLPPKGLASNYILLSILVPLLCSLIFLYIGSQSATWLIKNNKRIKNDLLLYYPNRQELLRQRFTIYFMLVVIIAFSIAFGGDSKYGLSGTIVSLGINIIAYMGLFFAIYKLIPHFEERDYKIISILVIIVIFSIVLTFLRQGILSSFVETENFTKEDISSNASVTALRISDFDPEAKSILVNVDHRSSIFINDYYQIIEDATSSSNYVFSTYYDCNYSWVADYLMKELRDELLDIPMDLDFWSIDDGFYFTKKESSGCYRINNRIYVFNLGNYGKLVDYDQLIRRKLQY